MQEIKFKIDDKILAGVCGPENKNLSFIEEKFDVTVYATGNSFKISGKKVDLRNAKSLFDEMENVVRHKGYGDLTDLQTISTLILANNNNTQKNKNGKFTEFVKTAGNTKIAPKNKSQSEIWKAIDNNDIVFSIGPAGTGKTYMAVAIAIEQFLRNDVQKIILVRPAVEAGESLGFLPGDFKEKIAPYLRPLYDALSDMLPREDLKRYIDEEVVEVVPLAYMRGRTLNNAFVILDEAQNALLMQMKMFLTRIGRNSKAIITGDVTQIDLSEPAKSGLVHVEKLLKDIKGIAFVYSNKNEVIRHKLVRDILKAYEDDFNSQED